MTENKNGFDSLESIIKIEPEEFQEISIDDVLRSRVNIFSDPVVLLERPTVGILYSGQYEDKVTFQETAKNLAMKGNKGLSYRDPHTCCVCREVFSSRKILIEHLENVHCQARKMFCDLCPKFFFTRKAILKHMNVHSEKIFQCNICDFKTAVNYCYERHKLTHIVRVECLICKKQVSSLNDHMNSHKPKKTCPVCQKVVQRRNFKNHMKTHSKALKCKECDKIFYCKATLKRHNLTKHYNKKLFECHCGEVFKNNCLLLAHQQTHKEKMECRVCHKLFSLLGSLYMHWRNKHLKTHGKLEGTRTTLRVLNRTGPFICDKCGSWSSSRESFRTHRYLYHRSFSVFCDLCPRSFTKKSLLALHMKKVHLKLRPFECNVCSYKASSKHHLDSHMLLHGPKTECKICHKFVSIISSHLKTHVKVKCSICSKVMLKSSLGRHNKLTHAQKNSKFKIIDQP